MSQPSAVPHEALKKSLRALVETSVHNTRHGAFFSQLKHNVDQIRATHYSPTKREREKVEQPVPAEDQPYAPPVRRNDKHLLVDKIQRQSSALEALEAKVRQLQTENATLKDEIGMLREDGALLREENAVLRGQLEKANQNPPEPADVHGEVVSKYKTALAISRHQCRDLKRRLEASAEANRFQQRVLEQLQGHPRLYGDIPDPNMDPHLTANHGFGRENLSRERGQSKAERRNPNMGARSTNHPNPDLNPDLNPDVQAVLSPHEFLALLDLLDLLNIRDLNIGDPGNQNLQSETHNAERLDLDRLSAEKFDLDLECLSDVEDLRNGSDESTTRLLNGELRDSTTTMLLRGHLSDPYDMFRHRLGPGAKLRAAVIAVRFIARLRAQAAQRHLWRQKVAV